jgi:hypothetical protein
MQGKDLKFPFPVNANLLHSNVLMTAVLGDTIKYTPHGIMTVSNELQGIVAIL